MFLSIEALFPPGVRSRIRPFLMEGRAVVPAAASSTQVEVVSTRVLTNYNAYILSYGVTVRGAPAYDFTGSLEFALYVNGGPYLDNNNNSSWTLERGSVAQPIPTLIQTQSGGLVQFLVRRAVAAAQPSTVDFVAFGWQVPSQAEPYKNCTV